MMWPVRAARADRMSAPLRSARRRWSLVGLLVGGFLLLAGAGAAAALEADTVGSYWRGLWWATSLMTTVGFVGRPPTSAAGAVLSAVLMIAGFLLLSLVSASLASAFVRESEAEFEHREQAADEEMLRQLERIASRLDALEAGPSREDDARSG